MIRLGRIDGSLCKTKTENISFYQDNTSTGFSIRIRVGGKTSGVGGGGIPRPKGMTLGWMYRSVPHLGDYYNLDLSICGHRNQSPKVTNVTNK